MAGKYRSLYRLIASVAGACCLVAANGLGATDAGIAAPVVEASTEAVVADLAPETVPVAASESEPATDGMSAPDAAPETIAGTPPARQRLDIDCLPEDLLDKLRAAHGPSVKAKACAPACLPAPAALSAKQLDDLYGRYGVVWCRSCVQISGHLSLKDVRQI